VRKKGAEASRNERRLKEKTEEIRERHRKKKETERERKVLGVKKDD